MSPMTTLRSAISSLGANKLRTGLALLGIVIGVAAVISTMSVGRGAQEAVTANIESLGTNLLFVRPGEASVGGIFGGQGSATTLTLEDANALVDPLFAPSVEAVAPELNTTGQIVAGRENTFAQVLGITPDYLSVRNQTMATGQFIAAAHVAASSEVVVLGSQISETLFGFRDPVGADGADQRKAVHRHRRPGEQRRSRVIHRQSGAGTYNHSLSSAGVPRAPPREKSTSSPLTFRSGAWTRLMRRSCRSPPC